ncbi:hypothetical protein [Xenorhabdus budapestensis]|uniref:hypothetical protein n=1 Tax=Xenorhabdus budapestensis TaxID=290110 RepID=UPI000C051C9A|nr:hypothetical protein [Xenorhabdus budapestensis]
MITTTNQKPNRKYTAYSWKHTIKHWQREVKKEDTGNSYTCMMAFIVACRLAGLKHDNEHNPAFNISLTAWNRTGHDQ